MSMHLASEVLEKATECAIHAVGDVKFSEERKTITECSKKIDDENEETQQQEKKLKTTKQFGVTSRWKIMNKNISKNLGYTLECECSKCGKKLSLKDAFCCFDPDRKIISGLHRGGLYSAFFCADCARKNVQGLA